MRSVVLDEAQAGIKIAGRNINNLRYADDTTLMAESEKELKSLLMKVKKESERIDLTLNIGSLQVIAGFLFLPVFFFNKFYTTSCLKSYECMCLLLKWLFPSLKKKKSKLRSWNLAPSLHGK